MNTVREKREALGLTLQELSKQVGVHFATISDWELGRKLPKPKNRLKLAEVLGCSVEELFAKGEDDSWIWEEENQSNNASLPPSPFAKYRGDLMLGGGAVDCYVLDTDERVISLRATVKAITNIDGGDLESYINARALKPYINSRLVLEETIEFNIPGTQMIGKGIKAENFLAICNAYVVAFQNNKLTTDRQREIALKCSVLLSSCAKIGLIALIDEATGYQYDRPETALQLKLKLFIADEMRAWEKTFPDDLWEQFGRLTNWKGSLRSRPKWWGRLVMELIYEALDADVAKYLKEHKPPPKHQRNYHQWLTSQYGLKQLITHIYQIIGIAKTCVDIKELKAKVGLHFKNTPIQLSLDYTQKN